MVYNEENYPNLVGLFKEIDVEGEHTDMSFSACLDQGQVEWGSDGLRALFARKRNLISPSFHSMLREMLRFNREAPRLLLLEDGDPRKAATLGEYLKEHGYSSAFAEQYLVPMAAALWSSSSADVMGFSALAMISFFQNHRMLQVFDRPQWWTPKGRSIRYVDAICKQLGDRLELGNAAVSVSAARGDEKSTSLALLLKASADSGCHATVTAPLIRNALHCRSLTHPADNPNGRWLVEDSSGAVRSFDHVILACHADMALGLLKEGDLDAARENALKSFRFADNQVLVHSDPALMPSRKAAWSSWNYLGTSQGIASAETKPVFVTYWLNKLQNLACSRDVFISLNPTVMPDPALTHRTITTRHPQFSPQGEAAQKVLAGSNGEGGLWFAGAWLGYGFHEDGLRTGLLAATGITGKPVPWMRESVEGNASAQVAKAAGKGNGHSSEQNGAAAAALVHQELVAPQPTVAVAKRRMASRIRSGLSGIVSAAAAVFVRSFMRRSLTKGGWYIITPDGSRADFGDPSCPEASKIGIRVYDWWFFVRVALEYDLGLARSYIAGEWVVDKDNEYADGLRRLFLGLVSNRDAPAGGLSVGSLFTSWIGYSINFIRYKLSMDNSIGGSRSNIAAHYDLSNELFSTFLDKTTMMYSSAIYDVAVTNPSAPDSLVYKGSLDEAQVRKINTLLQKARVEKHHRLLDIGFGWGGISIHAAKTIGCKVHGITLSKEQLALAQQRVKHEGLEHLVTFELIDYRDFAQAHPAEFDSIISCEMIEAVGHNYLGVFFAAVERLLKENGVAVLEAITTPESRYEEYLRSTDFINTIIFPGSCCPSLTALMSAMSKNSRLCLEGYINIGMHYAETLREWRMRFNDNIDQVKHQGFDAYFQRCWNYYFTYCEAAFHSRTEGCLILTFTRPGSTRLLCDSETRCIVGL
ncbi:unnamed protein product [Chrysoparadoxa australica]